MTQGSDFFPFIILVKFCLWMENLIKFRILYCDRQAIVNCEKSGMEWMQMSTVRIPCVQFESQSSLLKND
jgi:hypothetical protein